jgi:hypothetical protein
MHYIITNRRILKAGTPQESIYNEGDEPALPVFRIATFDPATARAQLVPDEFVESYDDLLPDEPADARRGSTRLFLDLYQRMLAARGQPKGDVLVFLHGFQYKFADSLKHLRTLHELYVAPPESPIAHLVYFSWPSRGKATAYHDDARDAIESGRLLGRLFRKTRQFFQEFFAGRGRPEFCGHRIHLAAHSMGNRVLQHLVDEMNHYPDTTFSLFGEVVLLNADIDWNALAPGAPLHALPGYCERTHIYNHYSDDALWISQTTKNAEKRLGKYGPASLDDLPPRTLVVDCSGVKAGPAEPKGGFAAIARRLSGAVGGKDAKERFFDHWGYLFRPEVITDLHRVFAGTGTARLAEPPPTGTRSATTRPTLFKLLDR